MKKFLLLVLLFAGLTSCGQDSEIESIAPNGGKSKVIITGDGTVTTRSGKVDFTGGYVTGAGLYDGDARADLKAVAYDGYTISEFEGGPLGQTTPTFKGSSAYSFDIQRQDWKFSVKFKELGSFVYDIVTTKANQIVPIVLLGENNEFSVDYGDGSEIFKTSDLSLSRLSAGYNKHTYSNPGTYTVTVKSKSPISEFMFKSYFNTSTYTTYPIPVVKVVKNDLDMSNLTSLYKAFMNTPIEDLCVGMFATCVKVNDCQSIFENCSRLKNIPDNLFANLSSCTDFSRCFMGSGVSTLPSNTFKNCVAATDLSQAFAGSKLFTIPIGLFNDCTNVSSFNGCFSSSYLLESIPDYLFATCTNAKDFEAVFSYCKALKNIPDNLFYKGSYQSLREAFQYSGVTNFTGNLIKGMTQVYLYSCFEGCSSFTNAIPELWDGTYNVKYGYGQKCFSGCINASNYAQIPVKWKQ